MLIISNHLINKFLIIGALEMPQDRQCENNKHILISMFVRCSRFLITIAANCLTLGQVAKYTRNSNQNRNYGLRFISAIAIVIWWSRNSCKIPTDTKPVRINGQTICYTSKFAEGIHSNWNCHIYDWTWVTTNFPHIASTMDIPFI